MIVKCYNLNYRIYSSISRIFFVPKYRPKSQVLLLHSIHEVHCMPYKIFLRYFLSIDFCAAAFHLIILLLAFHESVSAQSFFTCSYLESNLYLCCVSLQGYFFTTISNFHLHALLRAAGNLSLLRRKITPYLHIIWSFVVYVTAIFSFCWWQSLKKETTDPTPGF